MKVVVVVVAVLVTLGLAALGMVAAEKVMVPSSPSDHVAHLGSPDQGESAPATSARLSPIREIAEFGFGVGLRLRGGPRCIRYAGVLNSRSFYTGARRPK